MNPRNSIKQYNQIDVHSAVDQASPHRLIQMLFEGSLKAIQQAKGHLQRDEKAARGEQISKAISIIGNLQGALDLEQGGEVAANLDRLYDYMSQTLAQANLESSAGKLDEVAQLLIEIKQGWDQIPESHHQTSALKEG